MNTMKAIRSPSDLEAALARIEEIFDAEEGTPEDDELSALFVLVEAYEEETVPIPPPDPISAIKFRMDQAGLAPRDLIPILVVQRNLMASKQVLAVPPTALGMGTAGGRIAGPAVVHDGDGAVGRGTGAGQDRVHQQTGLGHGQAGVLFLSRSVSRTTKKWASMTRVA